LSGTLPGTVLEIALLIKQDPGIDPLMGYNFAYMTVNFACNFTHERSQYAASSAAIAERPRCRVGQFWLKAEDDILHTVNVYLQPL